MNLHWPQCSVIDPDLRPLCGGEAGKRDFPYGSHITLLHAQQALKWLTAGYMGYSSIWSAGELRVLFLFFSAHGFTSCHVAAV